MLSERKFRYPAWPTIAVAAAIYLGFFLITWFFHALPLWITAPIGIYLLAWHGSVQHETVHGHPFRRAWMNEALVFPSLWLWFPYRRYRTMHLEHHQDELLTDPQYDTESSYLSAQSWVHLPKAAQSLLTFNNTFVGRMLIGPLVSLAGLLFREIKAPAPDKICAWLLHGASVALVLWWVIGVCNIPVEVYLFAFVYPAISLSLVRSFAEHRAECESAHRTAVVEANPFWSLLFLNNNLHALHHAEPSLPWYALPACFRIQRAALLQHNGNHRYAGYGEIAYRYALIPRAPVVHPFINGVDSRPPDSEEFNRRVLA